MNISNLINMKYGTRKIKVVFNLWKRLKKDNLMKYKVEI